MTKPEEKTAQTSQPFVPPHAGAHMIGMIVRCARDIDQANELVALLKVELEEAKTTLERRMLEAHDLSNWFDQATGTNTFSTLLASRLAELAKEREETKEAAATDQQEPLSDDTDFVFADSKPYCDDPTCNGACVAGDEPDIE